MHVLIPIVSLIGCGPTAQDRPGSGTPSDTGATEPQPITEVFVVEAWPTTDILFVLDDSCSMGNEQEALSENFPAFWQELTSQPTLWHIGLVTTDTNFQAGRLQQANNTRFVTPSTTEPEGTMAGLFARGVSGSPNANVRAAIYAALGPSAPPDNAGFYRADAPLHLVIVTDDFDGSRGPDLPAEGFEVWLRGLKPNGEPVTVSSLVDPETGTDHLALTESFGGVEADISEDPDWSGIYDALARTVARPPTRFALAQPPQSATLEVMVVRDGSPQPLDDQQWAYDAEANAITMTDFPVATEDEVRVTYVPAA